MDISVIIVNYNTKELTHKCIKSIYDTTFGVTFEIIVVDNNSSDNSYEYIISDFPDIKFLKSGTNLGFGKANNLGVDYASGKYLFFLNSDTIVLNNSMKYFFDFMETNKNLKTGVAGSVLLDENYKVTHSSRFFPSKWEECRAQFTGYFSKKDFKKVNQREYDQYLSFKEYIEVDYVTGADMFISKSLFEETGRFDPYYFMYFEESDLQLRLHKSGYKNVIINGPEILHLQGSSDLNPDIMPERRIRNDRSKFYFFKKWSGKFSYLLFRVAYFFVKLPLILDIRIPLKGRFTYLKYLITG